MFIGLGTAVRFEKQGQKLRHEFRESLNQINFFFRQSLDEP